MRFDRIIPLGQDAMRLQIDPFLLLSRDFPSRLIRGGVQPRLTSQSLLRLGGPNKLQDRLVIHQGLPGPIHADEAKVGQVLLNLVDNSSKFTPEGGKLKIELVRKGNWCQVSVIDNGIGIKEEDQGRIFEPFCQLDDSLTGRKSGTGLGLTLTRQIVERHGGQIWVESEYGGGSRFIFTLPLAPAPVS